MKEAEKGCHTSCGTVPGQKLQQLNSCDQSGSPALLLLQLRRMPWLDEHVAWQAAASKSGNLQHRS